MDCIADFRHVNPLMLRLMYQAKGPDRLAPIRDAMPLTGLGDGTFSVWGDRIRVWGGLTSLVRPAEDGATEGAPTTEHSDGSHQSTLAGWAITMRDAPRNTVPLHQGIHMASLAPARTAGFERNYGSIEVGKRALILQLLMMDCESYKA
jgi:N-acetylglucosamine-6-phosphate deacetylase